MVMETYTNRECRNGLGVVRESRGCVVDYQDFLSDECSCAAGTCAKLDAPADVLPWPWLDGPTS